MHLTVELTLYPLQDNYLPFIKTVVDKLNSLEDIDVQTFPTATILCGDYDDVMKTLSELVRWSHEQFGKCVFVAKFLPGYKAI